MRTNLIEAYDLLSEFARKHLPDKFVLDGDERKSARDIKRYVLADEESDADATLSHYTTLP